MSDGYSVIQDGVIARLTFERPDMGNLLTLAMLKEIAKDIREAGTDPSINAMVVRGAGDDFCKGRDPAGAPEGKPTTALEMRDALIEPILGVYSAIRDADIPVISGAQGLVNGLGCGITAISDVTIAADNARFAMPEMRANLPPTLAMLAHLDRIPPKSLLGMVYSTDTIDANRAVAIGLVSDVVPLAELDTAIEDLLEKLAGYERASVVTCKSYLKNARGADYQTANDLAGNLLSVVLSSRK
jgi:enoyl-CoA hydratase